MSLLPVGFGASGDDYEITDSLRLRSSASAYLSRTPASAGNRRTWTLSWWAKRGALGSTGFTVFSAGTGTSGDTGELVIKYDNNYPDSLAIQTTNTNVRFTNALYRDPSAWHHVVVAFDTTQATAANRHKVYVNGEQVTSFNISNNLAQNTDTAVNNTVTHEIGVFARINTQYFDGYLTEVQMIDGQQLTADDFGQYDANGTWKAKEYTGTYGTNGFYLPMKPTTQADGFNTVLYSGNGSSQSITGVGFSPDLIWIKDRTGTAGHALHDAVRTSPYRLNSSSSTAEGDESSSFTGFATDGFSLAGNDTTYNNSSRNYVAWGWDAGSGSPVSNTDGDINSTVKANDSYGFSIVSYTGNGTSNSEQTIGHGLSTAPSVVIVKNRTSATRWQFYSTDLSSDATYAVKNLLLNSSNAESAYSSQIRGIQASDTFSVRDVDANGNGMVNKNGDNYIAYCFSEVAAYSDFGSYTGTGSAGKSVTGLGFQPAWLMIKETTSTGNWAIIDTTRSPNYDAQGEYLYANLASASGGASAPLTFDSDGFTINSGDSDTNSSGQTYIYMAFADTRDAKFNFDESGNKNNWLPNNINSNAESETTYDLMKDTPSLVDENAANFATLNPLQRANGTLSNGNLSFVSTTTRTSPFIGTISVDVTDTDGYWYEVIPTQGAVTNYYIGFAKDGYEPYNSTASTDAGFLGFLSNGHTADEGTYIGTDSSAAWVNGDVVGIGVKSGGIYVSINGVPANSGSPLITGKTGSWKPYLSHVGGGTPVFAGSINFGQQPFKYTPPTGFKKYDTFNLPDSTIEDGSDYFAPLLYDGAGGSQNITGLEFQPDWVWIKSRSAAYTHGLFDANRGVQKLLQSNSTAAEITNSIYLTSFNSDGFSIGGTQFLNGSGETFVSWNWKANGSGVLNEVGSIDSTVSVNTTAGFSIVSYTGNNGSNQTVGHGLGTTPSMFIIKNRTNAASWPVYHKDISTPLSNAMYLNSTNAAFSWAYWGTGGLSSTVFPVHYGSADVTNQSGKNYIAYVFAEVEGYSSFGSYTGNGSTDGPFIYTGFRPAFVVIKKATGTVNANAGWILKDATRDVDNVVSATLQAESAGAEYTSGSEDFLSNGFKIRTNNIGQNTSGSTYIYMAFAENPFKNANAR